MYQYDPKEIITTFRADCYSWKRSLSNRQGCGSKCCQNLVLLPIYSDYMSNSLLLEMQIYQDLTKNIAKSV